MCLQYSPNIGYTNNHNNKKLDTPLQTGDTISILASRDASGCFSVTNTTGLIVLRPDRLISSTSVVAGVFCKRKAVLQERWRGIDSANSAGQKDRWCGNIDKVLDIEENLCCPELGLKGKIDATLQVTIHERKDKESPQFEKKLPREVGRIGTKLMKSLNIQQQRAVLRALAAKDYALLQGLPGTGKTQTISVLIQMLVALKQRVLVTAHTHSAVDTVLQCTVLRPLFAANRFVLVGDPEQLPPVVRSRAARRLGMEVSLFHRLMSDEATSTLQLQYRMNKALADLANKKLSHFTTEPWLLKACGAEAENAALFLDMKATAKLETSKTCVNPDEACIVLALVDALTEGGVLASDIGVISPFRDQVALLRRALLKQAVEEGEVLNDQRRLAVGVTRAKHKLLVVGNSTALQRYEPLKRLIEFCPSLVLELEKLSHFTTEPWLLKACGAEAENAALFLDMKATAKLETSKTCVNPDEACIVLALVDALTEGGVLASDIGVISPFRDQVALLRRALLKQAVEVSTVDQFQGRDKKEKY
ncbi:hypothetical protein MSG28_005804 [Choristoneura fumiferana]|uniref:Uncharacterized protein n=1 Tax=Choristoneura fumiferana TaxID=7141 RepID=A0ACC0L124_CHOFU|nr:hypothetical protein MSG28_005804 [Choristoneura fumiferana]